MAKKTLPSIRVNEETLTHIAQAVKKYNQKSLVELTLQEFRRLSYEYLAQTILQDKPLDIKLSRK